MFIHLHRCLFGVFQYFSCPFSFISIFTFTSLLLLLVLKLILIHFFFFYTSSYPLLRGILFITLHWLYISELRTYSIFICFVGSVLHFFYIFPFSAFFQLFISTLFLSDVTVSTLSFRVFSLIFSSNLFLYYLKRLFGFVSFVSRFLSSSVSYLRRLPSLAFSMSRFLSSSTYFLQHRNVVFSISYSVYFFLSLSLH